MRTETSSTTRTDTRDDSPAPRHEQVDTHAQRTPRAPIDVNRRTRSGVGPVTWLFAIVAMVATTVAVVVVTSAPVEVDTATTGVATPWSMEALAAAGSIPADALRPASPDRDQLIAHLAATGSIPAETVRPTSPSRDELMARLVDSGSIPAASLDPTDR